MKRHNDNHLAIALEELLDGNNFTMPNGNSLIGFEKWLAKWSRQKKKNLFVPFDSKRIDMAILSACVL